MIENISTELSNNGGIMNTLLSGLSSKQYLWKSQEDQWCLLEVVCHLYDEEREDFRARVKHIFESPLEPMPSIYPLEWVNQRKYLMQDYQDTLDKFIAERSESVRWLDSLHDPNWENVYHHESFGEMTAQLFLSNWVAHDYLHIRQILKLKFEYLKRDTREDLLYAGDW